ncbi:hypothetical protein CDL12_15931 [Handroanthus impetiginosus]|uniref:NAC domain-containing protein n=1 Tax=Handroanthus impetiginosus TaxID=429701 RepID=A0A2G9H1T9_9LAMI|nr:hypothetical protein CDL12_15931 [Handroanthus impetiginosus]
MVAIIASFLQETEERRQSRIPIGFRFLPEDVELLDYYLLPRLKGEKLPADFIMDLDVYQYDPHQLPLGENKAYFFTREPRRNSLEDASIRPTPNGYWKVHEENIPIYRGNEIIGFKNELFFYTGNNPIGNQTDWEMVEYKYNPNMVPSSSTKTMEMDSCIVCRVSFEEEDDDECLMEESLEEESGFNEGNF